MDLLTIIVIAVGLSLDAFAAAIAQGVWLSTCRIRHGLIMALSFGIFQAGMPVIGWALGLAFREVVQGVDHWIAFVLLGGIGLRMIFQALKQGHEQVDCSLGAMRILTLAFATSIDALVIGITFSLLQMSILIPVLMIGLVTFGMSLLGVFLSHFLSGIFGEKVEIMGGIILIGIGVKIALSHLGLI